MGLADPRYLFRGADRPKGSLALLSHPNGKSDHIALQRYGAAPGKEPRGA